MARLLIQRSGQEPQVFELPEKRAIQIGRADSNELILRDSSVSRVHATLARDARGKWLVTDRNSANGVLVNSHFVTSAELKNGDEIGIGAFTIRFEDLGTQDLRARSGTDLPTRLTLVMARREVELALSQKPPAEPPLPSAEAKPTAATAAVDRRASLEERLRSLEHENRLLTLLYQVSRALGEPATVEDVAAKVLELVLQIEGVERGYAMLLDEKGEFLPAVIRYRNRQESVNAPHMILSQSIIQRVMREREPLLVEDARMDERFAASQSMALSGMQSAMCAPLRAHDRLFGLLYVDNLNKRGMFTQDDLNVFAVIAAQSGLAIDIVRAKKEVAQQIIQMSALERFLSPGLARKIASEAADLKVGGENQKVTVLFGDIRGFTTMAETLRPEETVEILNRFFKAMTDVIFAHEGTLDKYLGDGLMALFGAPFAKENDAFNAVRTAIDMQVDLAELNREFQHEPLRMGIGINTGQAIVGYMGTARRLDYTAIGDTVNIASRLTAYAEPGQILVTAATYAELDGRVPARPLMPVRVKGKAAPLEVYEVQWRSFSR
jgi:adenylate cyclase